MKQAVKRWLAHILSVALVAGSVVTFPVVVEAAETTHDITKGDVVISGCESGCPGHVITGETVESTVTVSGTHKITLDNVYIDVSAKCAFLIADNNCGDVQITLVGSNYISSGGGYAGIQKNGIENVGTLAIDGTGSLQVNGGNVNGIINDPKYEFGGAGIGGDALSMIGTSKIVINGGIIYATGGAQAAGIGSGSGDTASDIIINGGSVSAFGGIDKYGFYPGAAGIGGGFSGASSGIQINGGSVYVKSQGVESADAVFGYNIIGNEETEGRVPICPSDSSGKKVHLLKLENGEEDAVEIDGKVYVPNVHRVLADEAEDTVLYVYLTEDKHTVKLGETFTSYVFEEGKGVFLQEVTSDMFLFEKPADLEYDGNGKEAVVSSDVTQGKVKVRYFEQNGVELTDAPVKVGTYTVKADVETSGDYASATGITGDMWSFEIMPAKLTVTSATAESREYNKSAEVEITSVVIDGKIDGDDVGVDINELYGELSSANVGTYTQVVLPKLTIKGVDEENYVLEQPKEAVSVNVEIEKASVTPNKPGETLNVSRSTETVGSIDIGSIYEGWDWAEEDKAEVLVSGNSIDVTAVYKADDADNYKVVETVVSIFRSDCEHEEAEGICVSANAVPEEKEATCTQDGVGHTICKTCGIVMRTGVVIPAKGHGGGIATCEKQAVCETCEEPYGKLDPENHCGRTDILHRAEATCVSAGYTGDVCCLGEGCGAVLEKGTVIPALNHKGTTELENAKAATCVADGYTGDVRCSKCKDIVSKGKVVKAKGHNWDAGVITKKPTATKTGQKKYTCTVCHADKTETLKALGAPAKGTKVADDKGLAVYKVTKAGLKGGCVEYVSSKKKQKKADIPSTVVIDGITYKVTSIASKAFSGNKTVTTVTIGKNVTKIGAKAFYNCKKLKNITIRSKKLKNGSVGKNAFKGIAAKATIKVPKTKKSAYKEILKKAGVGKKAKYKNV